MKSFITPAVLFFLFTACGPVKKSASGSGLSDLQGNWQLNYITGPRIAFDGLYPRSKPAISFDTKRKKISGNTGCNSFSGPLIAESKKISFTEPMAMTKVACPGEGETIFLEALKKNKRV
ncbi:MAG: META domain-containing protein [Bacteroidota bacterium]